MNISRSKQIHEELGSGEGLILNTRGRMCVSLRSLFFMRAMIFADDRVSANSPPASLRIAWLRDLCSASRSFAQTSESSRIGCGAVSGGRVTRLCPAVVLGWDPLIIEGLLLTLAYSVP